MYKPSYGINTLICINKGTHLQCTISLNWPEMVLPVPGSNQNSYIPSSDLCTLRIFSHAWLSDIFARNRSWYLASTSMSFAPTLLAIRSLTPPPVMLPNVATIMEPTALYFHIRVRSEVSLAIVGSSGLEVNCDTTASRQKTTINTAVASSYSNYRRFKNIIHCTSISIIFNSYSSRTRRIWADIYITNEAVGRVGYYQLISGKSEKNNCFSKFSSSPITGNCHSTHLFPLHKTYSENITWPVINARSSWRAKTYWMNWQRAERIVRSKNTLMSVSSKNLITLRGQKVSQCQPGGVRHEIRPIRMRHL